MRVIFSCDQEYRDERLNIFDKNLSWKDRNLNKVGIEDILNVIKATYDKPTANIFNCEKLTFL